MALVRPNPDKLHSRFLHYYFLSPKWRQTIDSNIIIGATVNRIPIKDLPNFEVNFPPLKKQRKIASLLSSYDDLIENNQQRIQLLEESARLLYKEWFVHLRFPGHEHTKIIDGVPEGWKKEPLGNLCYQYKKTIKPNEVPPNTPYIGLGNIPRRSITLSSWETSEKVKSNKYIFQKGDILFGKIRPYFHKVGFALCNGITSSDSVVLRAKEGKYYCYILAYVSSDIFVRLASKTCREGAKMPRADWKFLEKQAVLVPSKILLMEFSEQQNDILKQLKTLACQNQKLAQARDLLLPRLMNGEIEV
jgi:type I restriction enzyme S subunit